MLESCGLQPERLSDLLTVRVTPPLPYNPTTLNPPLLHCVKKTYLPHLNTLFTIPGLKPCGQVVPHLQPIKQVVKDRLLSHLLWVVNLHTNL